jgi:hypothetical protein
MLLFPLLEKTLWVLCMLLYSPLRHHLRNISSGALDDAFADAFKGSMGNIYDEKKNLECFNPKSPLYFHCLQLACHRLLQSLQSIVTTTLRLFGEHNDCR